MIQNNPERITGIIANIIIPISKIRRCVHTNSLQSCPTHCSSMDCSLPGSSVHGILQARILEWVAMPSPPGEGIFLTQGSNLCLLCLLHWQAGSLPLAPPGKPQNKETEKLNFSKIIQRICSRAGIWPQASNPHSLIEIICLLSFGLTRAELQGQGKRLLWSLNSSEVHASLHLPLVSSS